VAAYAAASIAEAPPLRTAIFALRIGLVKFIVPFAFAFYPVLLLVEESGVKFDFWKFSSAISRLLVVIYLVSSATIAFDQRRLPAWEIILRLILAFLVLVTIVWVHWIATATALLFLAWHYKSYKQS
jgi:TRAP-type uncharacterized transport system fused permease subunit